MKNSGPIQAQSHIKRTVVSVTVGDPDTTDFKGNLEAPSGFEPLNKGFADRYPTPTSCAESINSKPAERSRPLAGPSAVHLLPGRLQFSDAIRLGAALTPQAFCTFRDSAGGTCAIGAALTAACHGAAVKFRYRSRTNAAFPELSKWPELTARVRTRHSSPTWPSAVERGGASQRCSALEPERYS